MHATAERVQQALTALGVRGRVRELPGSTRTAAEAAAAIGTTVPQIAKSLVFRAGAEVVLVVASGAHRVDVGRLAERLGAPVAPLDARSVKETTGFAVGGVPPVGHATPLRTFLDADLFRFEEIWAAGGTPHAVFPTTAEELARITGGEVVEIAAVC